MKSEYEDKVSFLEKQSIDQSKLLAAQTEQLNNITKGMLMDYQNKRSVDRHPVRESNLNKKLIKQHSENFKDDNIDSESSHKSKKSNFSKELKQFSSSFKSKPVYSKFVSSKKPDEPRVVQEPTATPKPKDKKYEKSVAHKKTRIDGNKYSSLDESEKSESTLSESETETDEDSEEETTESEESRTESTNDEIPVKEKKSVKVVSFHLT